MEWIDAKKQKPKQHRDGSPQRVLAINKHGVSEVVIYSTYVDSWWNQIENDKQFKDVQYWMELPDIPKEME